MIGLAKHSETEEDLVVYEDEASRLWVRPLGMFREKVEIDGKQIPRFEYIL